ncbi:MAG: polysulfide reductase [Desulfobulbaceae bacterium A2]|nr:MAG: polysulfide reductase [Desulfobulbaceae bacterium A2]
MNTLQANGFAPVTSALRPDGVAWTVRDKLLLGLSPRNYIQTLVRNPFNWIILLIYLVGLPVLVGRFIYGLGWATHASYEYPWGLFLGWGLFTMVPLSASGFMLGTTVELFGRKDFKPIERLGLLNGLLGYFFAVVFLEVDLGQPWRLIYPMFVSLGPAAVLFLVAWHVATYLSVQIAELVPAFSELFGLPRAKTFIRSIVLGLTVSGIILSTLHQGALGALFTYAPGKVHPLWLSTSFQWFHFFVSAIFAGLSMLIVVSTICARTMRWRCDSNFLDNLDRLTLGLSKGCALALITYLVTKFIGIAHDNEWEYLLSSWGGWFILETLVGVVLPLVLFTGALRREQVSLARLAALLAVIGIILNRLNTAIFAYNWQLYQEIPHWREVVISLVVYTTYIVVYRAILARLPILYTWRNDAATPSSLPKQ